MSSPRLLVLGGTAFVGRAVAAEAIAGGCRVTTLNRGETHGDVDGVEVLRCDRTDRAALEATLAGRRFDVVVDTWSGAPRYATSAAALLGAHTTSYVYISSRSVYRWPIADNADESHPVVDGDPAADNSESDYARRKRGGELGVLAARPDALIARCGLILGPHETVGRLPWWLLRLARGGRVPAPGPTDRPLQLIDARDLARWIVRCTASSVTGVFDAVSHPGHTTIGELLSASVAATGSRSELVWVTPEAIEAAGISPWTNLPIWAPPTGEIGALHNGDTRAAAAAGLLCRPITDTVADTWSWLSGLDPSTHDTAIPGLAMHGMTPEQEARLLG